MSDFRFVNVLGDGLFVLDNLPASRLAEEAWVWSLVKVRKPRLCGVTGYKICVGEMAFKPVTNKLGRDVRISRGGMARLMEDVEG